MHKPGIDQLITQALLCDKFACCLQFRFVVDGAWKWADDQPVMRDEEGNYINVLEVHEFVPENLESLSGFEPPPSPPSRCFVLLIMSCTSCDPKICAIQSNSILQAGHISL